MNKTLHSAASFLSTVLHPLLMALYATFILFNSGSYLTLSTAQSLQKFIYLVVFISTYLIPAAIVYVMWKKGWVESLHLERREDRTLPFLATLFCYAAGMYLLLKLPLPRLFGIMVGGGAFAILFSFLVNLKWKISIHMVGIGGLMGLLFSYAYYLNADMQNSLVVLAVCAGLLGTSRLILKAHIPSQVYVGFISGFLLEFFYFHSITEILSR